MENVIIAISREFASGGRLVGKSLSEKLGIPFYDREIIELAAEKSGMSPDFIRSNEEQASSGFLFNIPAVAQNLNGGIFMQYETPIGDKTFIAPADVIRELADKGSCVILGRCGGYLLRDRENCVSVFLHSSLDDRIERAVNVYHLEYKGLADSLLKMDKSRGNYHKYYTGETWDDVRNYDLAINTAKTGIDGAVQAVLAYIGAL